MEADNTQKQTVEEQPQNIINKNFFFISESGIEKTIMYNISHLIMAIFALYLSFKCNPDFDLGAFLMALVFPYIYIAWKFATSSDFCGLRK